MEEIRKINGELLTLDEAVNKNNRLIWSTAYRYVKKGNALGLQIGDLYSLCGIGFLKAFERFDPDNYNVKFSTYAVPMMIGEMQRYFRDHEGDLKFSRRVIELSNKIARAGLEEEKPELISLHFDVTIDDVTEALEFFRIKNARRIEETIYSSDGEEITLGDQLGTNKMSDHTEIDVNLFLESLKPRDRKMIELTTHGKTQLEIGEELGISQVQVSRLMRSLYPTIEKFFGYPEGYFSERKTINSQKERIGMGKKLKRKANGDLEKAKELLKTTSRTPWDIAKETGISDSSAYYWAKKIREPKSQENPITIKTAPIVIKDYVNVKEVAKEIEKITKQQPAALAKEGAKVEDIEFGVPDNDFIKVDVEKQEREIQLQEEYLKAEEAAERAEEYRKNLLRKANIKFGYDLTTHEISPSDLHTLFTQAGNAAAASGLEKLNVSVIITTEQITV